MYLSGKFQITTIIMVENYKYKVTVGMPVYGVEKYIRKCMLSVLNQTFQEDFEILAVDDWGPDNSVDIIKELQITHPRGKNIRIITQPHNMGCWAARNRILEEAQGEYILLIDSDDFISEDCIEKLYCQAKEHNAEVVYGSVLPVDWEGNSLEIGLKYLNQPYLIINEEDGLAKYANKDVHPTLRDFIWNILFRHDFIEKYHIRFKQAKFNDDMICSCDMIPYVSKAVLIPDYTYYYVIRDNSLSNYQHRNEIKLDEIQEFIRIYSYLKNKCLELKDKPYFETRCTKGMILMFFMICGVLKNKDRINPRLNNRIIRDAMKHPLQLNDILHFGSKKLINVGFYFIGVIPPTLSVLIIKFLGKKKHLL